MLHWAHAYDTDHSETPFLINSKSGSSCCWELHLQSEEKKTSYALATRTEASATDELESKCISSICRLSRDGLAPVVSSWVLRCCPASQQGTKMKERVIWPTERGNGETWQQMGALIELYSTDGSTACRSFLWVSMKRTVLRKHNKRFPKTPVEKKGQEVKQSIINAGTCLWWPGQRKKSETLKWNQLRNIAYEFLLLFFFSKPVKTLLLIKG